MLDFELDSRLEYAETLPKKCYLDPVFLELEQKQIFRKTWQWVGHTDELPEPGSFLALNRFEEPILFTRDKQGQLHALSNVCRHRAAVVVEGKGCAKTLQCPYHGWTYDLDGRLRGQREFQDAKNWNPHEQGLPRLRLEQWGSFLFVNFDDKAPSLATVLGEIPSEVKKFGADLEDYRFLAKKEYTVECNWKVYVDNYLEGYHIPLVHPELFRTLDYAKYVVEPRQFHSTQHAPLKNAPGDALYYWVFPNFIVNIYPDNVSLNLILPLGPNRTYTLFEWYVRKNENPDLESTIRFSDEVQHEDIRICESVQKGLASSRYDRGRYCPARENGVHHFHSLWTQTLRNPA